LKPLTDALANVDKAEQSLVKFKNSQKGRIVEKDIWEKYI